MSSDRVLADVASVVPTTSREAKKRTKELEKATLKAANATKKLEKQQESGKFALQEVGIIIDHRLCVGKDSNAHFAEFTTRTQRQYAEVLGGV